MAMTIDLDESQCAVLIPLLERAIADIRVEVRRTRAPAFHDNLIDEEKVLKGLLAKIKPSE